MKIAVVATSYPRHAGDPAGHFVATEVRALEAAGHEVIVIAPNADNDAFGWPGAWHRIRERPARALGAMSFVLSAARALARARVDRVIAHWIVPCAWPLALASGAPLEVVAHGSDVRLIERLPRAISRRMIAALIERGAELRFVSAELRARLARATGLDLASRTRIEPAAIEVSDAPSRAEARRQLAIAESTSLVLVVSRLVAEKRVEVALAAATLTGAECAVVGDGPERAAFERRFPAVRFLGTLPRPRALAWIAAADVLVSASQHEGAPTAIREARALGVPVVSARAGDLAAWAERDRELYVVG